jgi:hypothetical protein
MRRAFLIALTLAFTGSWSLGCSGQNICDRIASGQQTLSSKAAPCSGINIGTFNASACHQGQSACTSSDVATLNQTWDCLDQLGTCSSATQASWQASYTQCQTNAQVSNSACAAAVNFQ